MIRIKYKLDTFIHQSLFRSAMCPYHDRCLEQMGHKYKNEDAALFLKTAFYKLSRQEQQNIKPSKVSFLAWTT